LAQCAREIAFAAILHAAAPVMGFGVGRAITITLKTGAWLVTDSVSLLADAMESLVNLAGAEFGLIMVTIAVRPADEEHPDGHHKAEYFSSGFEGVLIVGAALAIIWSPTSGPQSLWSSASSAWR
jgi:divalent metal cation (Fe/Co/Zn/Cd) transporter